MVSGKAEGASKLLGSLAPQKRLITVYVYISIDIPTWKCESYLGGMGQQIIVFISKQEGTVQIEQS